MSWRVENTHTQQTEQNRRKWEWWSFCSWSFGRRQLSFFFTFCFTLALTCCCCCFQLLLTALFCAFLLFSSLFSRLQSSGRFRCSGLLGQHHHHCCCCFCSLLLPSARRAGSSVPSSSSSLVVLLYSAAVAAALVIVWSCGVRVEWFSSTQQSLLVCRPVYCCWLLYWLYRACTTHIIFWSAFFVHCQCCCLGCSIVSLCQSVSLNEAGCANSQTTTTTISITTTTTAITTTTTNNLPENFCWSSFSFFFFELVFLFVVVIDGTASSSSSSLNRSNNNCLSLSYHTQLKLPRKKLDD